MAKKGKTKRSTVRSKRKPNNPREALAWLHIIADHIQESLEAYLAHKPSRWWRAHWLADTRSLWWFANAVKSYGSPENKKRLGQLLGLERARGNPGGRRKPSKSTVRALEIAAQREAKSERRKTRQGEPAPKSWKEVRRDLGDLDTSPEALRQRHRRASLARAEDDAKEFAKGFATRLKQRLDRKPQRDSEAKGRQQSQGRPVVR